MGAGATEVERVRVLVLGPLAVERDGQELHVAGAQRRRLLALLASNEGRPVSADAIAEALWGDEPPPTSTKAIQNHVARLRRSFAALDGELIATTTSGYRLAVAPEAIDGVDFEQRAADGRRLLANGDAAGAAGVLAAALALWRGAAYADLGDAPFAIGEAARLDELRWAAVEDLAEARIETGALEQAIADLERLVRDQPGRERSWNLLIRGLYATGRQRDAVGAYQRARAVLVEEFGLEPGAELQDLERRILEQDPSLTVRRVPVLPPALRSHTGALFGRASDRAWLVDGWNAARAGSGQMRLLLGPVDSGRSRLVADLASTAVGDGGSVVYLRGEEEVASDTPGAFVDAVIDQSRTGPVLVAVDDAEWCSARTLTALTALVAAIPEAAVLLVVVADPSTSGAALHAVQRLADRAAAVRTLDPLDDETTAQLVIADGVDSEAVAAVVAVARGLPGVARREAAAWAERAATERLTADSASSIGARAAAAEARASVFDDVLALVAARARRDQLASTVWAGRQPYRSLATYDVQDADLFVGRERLVAELASRVLDRRLVAVVGASGSGKSSLVRAGLVPLVRSGRLPGSAPWRTAVIVPGTDPIATLDAVDGLDEPGTFLLVVDQFEEVFAAGAAKAVATRLVELSSDAALDVRIVIVLRSDQYPMLASVRRLADLVEDAQVLVGAPTEEELRRIVEVPAHRTGCVVDPALVARLVDDVAGHDAALPLVSAALAEVWEQRSDDTLTLSRYVELGGLAATVERMGSKALERAGEVPVREVMLRLVDVTDDEQWVRRRVPAAELGPDLAAAVDALVEARIVQRDGEMVDVVHEVVFTAWPQLARWLEEVRAELVLDRELRRDASAWEGAGRDSDYLYRGVRLAAGEELLGRREVDPLVRAFVAASTMRSDREQRSRTRRRRRVVGVLIVALLATSTLAVVALRQRSDARSQAAEARFRQLLNEVPAVDDYDQSLLLAVEARHMKDSLESRGKLLAAIQRSPAAIGVIRSPSEAFIDLAFTPDGKTLVASGSGRAPTMGRYDVATLQRERAVGGTAPSAFSAVSPDGRTAVMTYQSGTGNGSRYQVSLVDIATFTSRGRTLQGLAIAPTRLSFSPDGRYVGAVTDADLTGAGVIDAVALVWDVARGGDPVAQYRFEAPNFQRDLAFLPDSKRMLVAGADGTAVVDIASGAKVDQIDGAFPPIAVSHDGRTLAASTDLHRRTTIGIFDLGTGRSSGVLAGHRDPLTSLAFSPDGTDLASGSDDRSVIVWDVAERRPLDIFEGHAAGVNAVAFSPDGSTLWSAGDDRAIFGWGLRHDQTLVRRPPAAASELPALSFEAQGMVIGPTGRAVVFPSVDLTRFAIRDADTGETTPSARTIEAFISFSADEKRYTTVTDDLGLRVRDRTTGAVLADSKGSGQSFSPLHEGTAVFTPDGRSVVAVRYRGESEDEELVVLDASTLEPIGGKAVPVGSATRMVSVTPDGRKAVAVVSAIGVPETKVLLVDLESRRIVRSTVVAPGGEPLGGARNNAIARDGRMVGVGDLVGNVVIADAFSGRVGPMLSAHDGRVESISFAPDGSTFVTTGQDGAVKLWDTATQRLVGSMHPFGSNHRVRASFVTAGRVVIVDDTGQILEWDPRPSAWEAHACRVAGRNLTKAEWAALVPGAPYRVTCPGFPAGG